MTDGGKLLKEFDPFVGFWVYGPKKDFPSGSTRALPKEIKKMEYVRVGFSTNLNGISTSSRKIDLIVQLGRKAYLGKKIDVMDYTNLSFKHKMNKEGLLLCEHTLTRQSNGQQSKTESKELPQQSHSDGETTETDGITKVYA